MSTTHPRTLDLSLRDPGFRILVALLLVLGLAAVIAWQYLPPPLPRVVRLGTGPAGGHYARFGELLRSKVAERGLELELVATAGSRDNIERLLRGDIEVGLVQSGNLQDEEAAALATVATVFYEPVLVVEHADWQADHIEGGRIAVGVPGSGPHALAVALLADQGVREGTPPGTRLVEIGQHRAVEALQQREVDSAVFVTSLEIPWVRTLFTDPDLRVVQFGLAEAFTRHYRYLRRVVIPAGLIDLRAEIPAEDVEVIATTASLVIRPDAHGALSPLLIASAREQLLQGGLLESPGEFPSAHGAEAPLADEALQYFDRGPSFFYRWLPFRYAFAATRLAILAVPLLTLLYPLYRSIGPSYRWVIRRRVYRWYRVLTNLEDRMDASGDDGDLDQIQEELERIGEEIRSTHVPAPHGASLFQLRGHHLLLLDRLARLRKYSNDPRES